ncbi:PHP domain-containing protein, partial [Candidatus Woesearchaeota archaeon]|nr:PHP domain-containing protein [Candidatus Woesearchaeota archaeon]
MSIIDKPFVHLHCHDEYSVRDAMGRIEDYVEFAERTNLPAFAVTNHGSIGGFIRQYFSCKKAGIKPIFGCEVYVNKHRFKQPDEVPADEKKNAHFILLAKNLKGYRNLLKITSDAWLNGYYYRPRTDYSFIKKHSEGLIASSACMGGTLPRLVMDDNWDRAKQFVKMCKQTFEEFYIELVMIDMKENVELNARLAQLAKETNTPTIVTGDCHYMKKEDVKVHNVLILIANNKTMEDLKTRPDDVFQYTVKDLYYKTAKEMHEQWNNQYKSKYFTEKVFLNSVK